MNRDRGLKDARDLRERLEYDALTGRFTMIRRAGKMSVGKQAGSIKDTGHVQICIAGKMYLAHRLAWLYVTGDWPMGQIDHVNGVRNDNRFKNLRDVTQTVNQENRRRPTKANKVGLLGVTKIGCRYRASIRSGGAQSHLGVFETPEAAHACYLSAKRAMHEGCTL